jgi:hypothetical protein
MTDATFEKAKAVIELSDRQSITSWDELKEQRDDTDR